MGPLSLYLGHIHAYDCIQYIVYNCWDLFQASFTGVRESWRTSDGSSHHVNCKNPSWSRYCIFARFLFLLLTYFFFFRQLVSLKMLNTLPQVSISVTLYWFSLMNKHIWRRKNNWNRYKRTPRRFVRRFDPLFLPEFLWFHIMRDFHSGIFRNRREEVNTGIVKSMFGNEVYIFMNIYINEDNRDA